MRRRGMVVLAAFGAFALGHRRNGCRCARLRPGRGAGRFYRPEDIDIDQGAFGDGSVKWCVNNTGNESQDHLWGEAVCLADGTFGNAAVNVGPNPEGSDDDAPELQTFVVGTPELAMPDNMAFQPGHGNWVVHEDGDQLLGNNDLWDCLPDGGDDDQLSDGCIRIGKLNDLT